ncbi:MAG: CHAD domain-containing protein, partial [Chloroflexi bacterium]|nr:CHAD domain-containing protein [Chloroflexota bacterium]
MTLQLERELKYRVTAQAGVMALASMKRLGPFEVGPFVTHEVRDVYFDTPDRAFARAGFAFRFRQKGEKGMVTLKALTQVDEDNVHRRQEFESKTNDPLHPDRWPKGLTRDLALRVLGERTLRELFIVEQTRRQAPLLDDGHHVGEISLDRVRWRVDGFIDEDWVLEVELAADAEEGVLQKVAAALSELPYLAGEPQSKYERGMALLEKAEQAAGKDAPPPVAKESKKKKSIPFSPDESPLILTQRIVAFQGKRLRAQYEGVLAGEDPEAVHDARVAARRMRSALYFFRPWLPKKPRKLLNKRLRKFAQVLGAVRDLDVSMAYAHKYAGLFAPEAEAPIRAYLQAEREQARAAMMAYFNSGAYDRLLEALDAFEALEGPGKGRLSEVLPQLLRRAAAEVHLYDGTLVPECPVEHLHALRISIKRYRYLLEFSRHVTRPDCEYLIKLLVSMQDHLGDLHDADVGSKLAFELLRRPDERLSERERAGLLSYGRALRRLRDEMAHSFTDPHSPAPLWPAWRRPETNA